MTLLSKIRKVEKVFQKLERETLKFKKDSGLFCKAGCGKCCQKPDIEASPLEFLPLAYSLYKEGKSIEFLDKLESTDDPICIIYNPMNPLGSCSDYLHRGMICRLFGYAASTNKYGERQISTCRIIKEEQSENFQSAATKVVNKTMSIPVMREYYSQLGTIDEELARQLMPVNEAIQKAIEYVEFYYMYRGKRIS
jgi:uncharacterized protein